VTTESTAVLSPREALVGLAPLKEAPNPSKLKYETLQTSRVFVKFSMSSPPAQT